MPVPLPDPLGLPSKALAYLRYRRLLQRNQRDIEAVYAEVLANLQAIRGAWQESGTRRFEALGNALSTNDWRGRRYALTDPVHGAVFVEDGEIVAELDALAYEFERAGQRTYYGSDWERRLLKAAEAIRREVRRSASQRWIRLFFPGLPKLDLLVPDESPVTPRDAGEMQRRAAKALPREQASDSGRNSY